MSFRFESQEDALVLLDKMVITELTEELLYLLDIFIDVDGKSELIYDFPDENWEDVRIRETQKLADFCNSGKMIIWLTDDMEKEYQVKPSDGIGNFNRAIYASSGNLVFISASELIQCALYPEMEMDILYELCVQEGWYEISDINNGIIEYNQCEKYKDKKTIKNL